MREPTVDAVPISVIESWLNEIAFNNTKNYLCDACEEIISRLGGLRRYYEEKFCAVEQMPRVDAVPVRHGHWTVEGDCSECGMPVPTDDRMDYIRRDEVAFCPYCGAKMDEVVAFSDDSEKVVLRGNENCPGCEHENDWCPGCQTCLCCDYDHKGRDEFPCSRCSHTGGAKNLWQHTIPIGADMDEED